MQKQIQNALTIVKSLEVDGCVTGSVLLDFFEGQDIDLFCYSEASFRKTIFTLSFHPMFKIIDPLEQWKFDEYTNNDKSSFKKLGLITIKFKYNLCIDINIIIKRDCNNIFAVLSSFDMDIISKGYDLKTKRTLDLSENDGKIVHWNVYNPAFYTSDIWTLSKLLRQFERCIKYHNRGYNTDLVVKKYLELLEKLITHEDIFNSENHHTRIIQMKENAKIITLLLNDWLINHEFSAEELEILKVKTKEIL